MVTGAHFLFISIGRIQFKKGMFDLNLYFLHLKNLGLSVSIEKTYRISP